MENEITAFALSSDLNLAGSVPEPLGAVSTGFVLTCLGPA
jgi:hypothetical protein